MTENLDVLVMESHRHYADVASTALEEAGHRVHRCYDPEESGFPCRGVTSPADCPIDRGVDVALLVRPRVMPHPTPLETGVACAVRAGVPVVEKGTESLDPFAGWITRRVDGGTIADTCVEAVEAGWASLRERIERRTLHIVAGAGGPGPIQCAFERDGRRLRVRLSGPPLGKDTEQAVSIRVLDAVRAEGRHFDEIDVSYTPTAGGNAQPSPSNRDTY